MNLRHSYIIIACQKGVRSDVLAKRCGTSVRMIDSVYRKFSDPELRAVAETMSSK